MASHVMPLTPKIVERGRNVGTRYTVRYEADGKQREKSFRLKREAEDFRLKVEYDQRSDLFVIPTCGPALRTTSMCGSPGTPGSRTPNAPIAQCSPVR